MSKRIITLGKWNDKPIEWIVLKEETFGTLVLSKDILFKDKFDDNSNDWIKSHIRKYLNEDFYKKAFSEGEKLKIVNAKLEDVKSSKDNIFFVKVQFYEMNWTYSTIFKINKAEMIF